MPSPGPPRGTTRPLTFAPMFLANLLPLVGVVWLDWSAETLVIIYVVEVLVVFPLAGLKALFAQQPPKEDRESGVISVTESDLVDKHGSVTIHERLPPVYPRNLPFASNVIAFTVWVAIFVGVAISGLGPLADAVHIPTVLVAVGGLLIGHVVELWREYFGQRRYEDVSPYAVVETPARQAFLLMFLLIVLPQTQPTAGTFVLGAFVFVKLLVDWSGFRAERGGGGRLTGWLSGPEPDAEASAAAPEPPSVPDADPSEVVATSRRSAALAAASAALTKRAPFHVPYLFVLWVLVSAFGLGGDASPLAALAVTGIIIGLFGVIVAGDVLEEILRHDAMEYRRCGDHLVAYDTRLETPQWAAPVDTLRGVDLVCDRFADRYYGTRTVTVTTGWGDSETERLVGPVDDPETLVAAFELPISDTDLTPFDRRVGAAVVAGAVLVVVAAAAMAFLPSVPPGGLFYLFFLFPVVALTLRGVWRLGY
ncbi:uncharacterized protein NP_1864A [Natronomonas pharaonis DSM 2160]|uniref:Uncharacterized protein n=1 Tax=Natronomonas pharaonis (strain ATCC 35678 / DSM 2160 / CIP 103997 / JCM 8858 / NBRC 14720 / NCIMB 2260 / Gabara) TaxID=348780 RepID=A0A1U7EVI5_NATPD|nr:DUF6498-containing protein [Natronomonas pharaonis]CAI49023.1 uncharacterized protein NP_1864A [Natronomonas pharaonis DSM 2160]